MQGSFQRSACICSEGNRRGKTGLARVNRAQEEVYRLSRRRGRPGRTPPSIILKVYTYPKTLPNMDGKSLIRAVSHVSLDPPPFSPPPNQLSCVFACHFDSSSTWRRLIYILRAWEPGSTVTDVSLAKLWSSTNVNSGLVNSYHDVIKRPNIPQQTQRNILCCALAKKLPIPPPIYPRANNLLLIRANPAGDLV